jgi:hypothetical protein
LTQYGLDYVLGDFVTNSSGTDVMIFKIFSPKNSAKKLAFLTRNKAKLCKNLIITMFVFEKNAVFFAENRRKLAKIAENCGHNIDPWSPCSTLSASFRAKQ